MTQPPTARRDWIDLARALTIALVVLYHAGVGSGAQILPEGSTAHGTWVEVNEILLPVRMPLFFAISGMLAAGAIERPWRAIRRPRVADLLWTYLLWSLLFSLITWPRYSPNDPVAGIRDVLLDIPVLGGPYWFIAVLPLLFLASWACRRRPRLLLAVALALFVAAPVLEELLRSDASRDLLASGARRVTEYLLWYVLGTQLRGHLLQIGDSANLVLGGAGLLVFPLATLGLQLTQPPLLVGRLLTLLAGSAGIIALIVLVSLCSRRPLVAALGRAIGSRTLTIYLVHPLLIAAFVVLWDVLGARGAVPSLIGTPAADLLLIPIVTLLALVASVLADVLIQRLGPTGILTAPRRSTPRSV